MTLNSYLRKLAAFQIGRGQLAGGFEPDRESVATAKEPQLINPMASRRARTPQELLPDLSHLSQKQKRPTIAQEPL